MVARRGRPIRSGGGAVALNDRRNLMRALVTGIVIAGLALSACGRRGALEPPPGAEASEPNLASGDPVQAKMDAKPQRPFILDGLL